ncbi:unnamed protein product [Protopolystoma xenopodis]|uniref:Uncharacterized protein n=1 Tax=Protopolystoma xenopodis TaxID=117903 RepID=A0A3S4ZQ52_9PLAT|nr:unnamed protein product [Protopolystoma xenopodis]
MLVYDSLLSVHSDETLLIITRLHLDVAYSQFCSYLSNRSLIRAVSILCHLFYFHFSILFSFITFGHRSHSRTCFAQCRTTSASTASTLLAPLGLGGFCVLLLGYTLTLVTAKGWER